MSANYTATGTLVDGRTVTLDEPIPLESGRVKVIVESIPVEQFRTIEDFLEALQKRRDARGYVPRTREEIDRAMQEERDGWNDRP
ncbi:MAG: hypothetical protein KF873_12905 [Gemmataceae bacterium]|nr:hypothetical protein [Gemmataceae bacterium]